MVIASFLTMRGNLGDAPNLFVIQPNRASVVAETELVVRGTAIGHYSQENTCVPFAYNKYLGSRYTQF